MRSVVFQCPNTGQKVQHFTADEPDAADDRAYEPVTCLACGRLHFINRVTGKLLGHAASSAA